MKNLKNKLSSAFYTLLCVVILCTSCTSSNDFGKGKKQLEQQGYTNVKDNGYSWFCCDEKDTFSTGFTALDKQGNKVKGCICSGVLKGVTVRFE
jgi:hypothetical protein